MARRKPVKWNNRPLSRRMLRNIEAVYLTATSEERQDGLYWYQRANQDAASLASRYGITTEQAAGVIAALSPGRDWGLNLIDADRLIDAHVNGRTIPQVGTYGRKNVAKARKILNGFLPLDVLGGHKVRAFFSLINEPENATDVCVDRHAKAIAVGRPAKTERDTVVRPSQYSFFARHYLQAAKTLGLLPHQLQAVTWVTWRRLKADDSLDEIPF